MKSHDDDLWSSRSRQQEVKYKADSVVLRCCDDGLETKARVVKDTARPSSSSLLLCVYNQNIHSAHDSTASSVNEGEGSAFSSAFTGEVNQRERRNVLSCKESLLLKGVL